MQLVHVQQFDLATLDIVNATPDLARQAASTSSCDVRQGSTWPVTSLGSIVCSRVNGMVSYQMLSFSSEWKPDGRT